MADLVRFRTHARPVIMVVLLLAALLCFMNAVKQKAAFSNRAHQRQLDLYTGDSGFGRTFSDHNSSYSRRLRARDPYDGWQALSMASDGEYVAAKERGEVLLCWLEHPDEVPPHTAISPWDSYDELKEWGWEDKSQRHNGGEGDPGLKQIFDGSELDVWTNEDTKVVMEHTGEHPAEHGISYPPTGAKYENYMYPRHGLLVAEYNY
ncbi:hypothetical protein DOTSEDRAFT_71397, partial [Dothistroma septosporum NZE10]